MGQIINTKRNGQGVLLQVQCGYKEYLNLRGHLDKVHIFADRKNAVETHISQRGKNGATKYFLIPRKLRNGFKLDNTIHCQRMEIEDRIVFIYTVHKNQIIPSKREKVIQKYQNKK